MADSGDGIEQDGRGRAPGAALLIAAAPVGKGRLMDAAAALPALAAVPPGVLTGAGGGSVVELVDPADPQVVLTRLRTAAASPGPLLIHLIGQLTLDRKQQLPHLALARTTAATVRYTGFPWHWLAVELAHRPPGSTALFADLVADAGAWARLRADPGLLLAAGLRFYGTVSPPPDRRAVASPAYSRAVAELLRPANARPPLADLHRLAMTVAGAHPDAWHLEGTEAVTSPPTAGRSTLPPGIAAAPGPGAAGTGAAGTGAAGPGHGATRDGRDAQHPGAAVPGLPHGGAGTRPVGMPHPEPHAPTPGPAHEAADSSAPPQLAASADGSTAAPVPDRNRAGGRSDGPDDHAAPQPAAHHDAARARPTPGSGGPGAPTDAAPTASAHQTSEPARPHGEQHAPCPPVDSAAVAAQRAPGHDSLGAQPDPGSVGTGAPGALPPDAPDATAGVPYGAPGATPAAPATPAASPSVPPRPDAVPDPHPAILAAAREGRHGEAAAMAAAWEQQALRAHGAGSAEAVHWLEVRADLARLAADFGRSCELWTAAATARLRQGEPADAPDVVAAVDRAHHCWEQVGDAAAARGLAGHLMEVRRRVPGPRPGAVEALERRVDGLNGVATS
ncbi:hypothetical protein [Streptomyces sp. 8N616]|uniref:hypothetical protein n=1 Tax=Streptomyces sp. 8N616 TaxID=3457414 RepID=UPI003FD5635A